MKKFIKSRFISLVLILCMIFSGEVAFSASSKSKADQEESSKVNLIINSEAKEETGELDFIKSGDLQSTLFTNNKFLFYGGVFLVSASIIGIVFTIIPRNSKGEKRSNKNKHGNHYSSGKRVKK